MTLRLAGTENDSIVDGPGIRFTIFVQGCPHHCPGCHNPQTHDFAGGTDTDCAQLLARIDANPLLDGVTFSGGEPGRYRLRTAAPFYPAFSADGPFCRWTWSCPRH